ncbi:Cytochrome P450 monooxygenase alnD [Metarhizium brunneum]|uniref:Cytochrome P450 monooxygenase alnD n=1 Tax=Metarhizium brunneum TaxID=500148 RepID=A0A7D5UYH4_9HYPO
MGVKEFTLLGTTQCQNVKLEVALSDEMSDLKSDLANLFAITDATAISLHGSADILETIENVIDHQGKIGLMVDGSPIRAPHAPKELPFLGNHFEIYPDHMGNHDRLFTQYGSVIKTVNMGTTTYLTNSPSVSEAALSESEYFTKTTSDPSHPLYHMRDSTALFMCDTSSPAFHLAHKFIPPSMTPNAVRQYTPNMQQAIEECFSVFDELDRQDKAFHVYQYMFKLAGQIIYRIVLGLDVGHFKTIDTPAHEIIYLLGEYMLLMKKTSLSPQWYKYLPFGDHRRLQEVKKRAWALVDEAIDNAEVGGGGKDAPIQEVALDSTCIADYLKRAVDDEGNKLPPEYRLTNIVVLIGAGFVTSSSLLSWIIYALAKYPGNQERLVQELVDHGGSSTKTWSYDEINSLPFLDHFVKETHRLHNPSFQTARNTKKDVIVPGGWQMPAGAIVIPTFPSIHKNKDHWENPERFDPDRWADDATSKKRHRRAFTPFAAGPRGCVGLNVAKLEAKLALANLVYRYHFTDANKEPMQYDPEFLVIRPLNCYARARKRTSWPAKLPTGA